MTPNKINILLNDFPLSSTVEGENNIATTKIRDNYGAIQSFIFTYCNSNIGLFIIAPCKVITLNPLCILSYLLFF